MAGRRVSLLGTLASLPAANLKARSQGSVFLSKDGVVSMGHAVAFTGKTQKIALQARDSRVLRKLDAVSRHWRTWGLTVSEVPSENRRIVILPI
jgi:hypothetical protein